MASGTVKLFNAPALGNTGLSLPCEPIRNGALAWHAPSMRTQPQSHIS